MYISTRDRENYRRQRIKVARKLDFCKQKKQEFALLADFSENEEYHIYRKKVDQYTLQLAHIDSMLSLQVRDEVSNVIGVGSKIHLTITNKSNSSVVFDKDLYITTIDKYNPIDGYLNTNSIVYSRIEGQKETTWEMQSVSGEVHIYSCRLLES